MEYLDYGEVITWLQSHKNELTNDFNLIRELANRFDTVPGFTGEGSVPVIVHMIRFDHQLDQRSGVTTSWLEKFLSKNVTA